MARKEPNEEVRCVKMELHFVNLRDDNSRLKTLHGIQVLRIWRVFHDNAQNH